MKKGFTLIELLVVVLIIGILAGIAVPQYQVAVEKARVARRLPLFKSLLNAQQLYKMQNGDSTADMDLLDVSVNYVEKRQFENKIIYTLTDGTRLNLYPSGGVIVTSFPAGYIIDYYGESTSRGNVSGSGLCYPKENGGLAERVCKSMGPESSIASGDNTHVYMFSY